jgi:hypothetical protein
VSCSRAQPIRVAARTLLDLVKGEGYGHVDAVKLDVEGAEDLILEPFLAGRRRISSPGSDPGERGQRWQSDLPGPPRSERLCLEGEDAPEPGLRATNRRSEPWLKARSRRRFSSSVTRSFPGAPRTRTSATSPSTSRAWDRPP